VGLSRLFTDTSATAAPQLMLKTGPLAFINAHHAQAKTVLSGLFAKPFLQLLRFTK
jgi:hypothetical protein